MNRKLAVLPADGIGPETTVRVLHTASRKFNLGLQYETHAMGGAASAAMPPSRRSFGCDYSALRSRLRSAFAV